MQFYVCRFSIPGKIQNWSTLTNIIFGAHPTPWINIHPKSRILSLFYTTRWKQRDGRDVPQDLIRRSVSEIAVLLYILTYLNFVTPFVISYVSLCFVRPKKCTITTAPLNESHGIMRQGIKVETMKSPSLLPYFDQATSAIFAKHVCRQENTSNHNIM
jgi:hypothetical protein